MSFDPFVKTRSERFSFYQPTSDAELTSMENNNDTNDVPGVVADESKDVDNETKRDDALAESDMNNETKNDEALAGDGEGGDGSAHSYDEEVVDEDDFEDEVVDDEVEIVEHADGEIIDDHITKSTEEPLDHSEEEIIEDHAEGDAAVEEEVIEENLDHSEEEVIEEHVDHGEEIVEEHVDHGEEIVEEHVDHSEEEIIEEPGDQAEDEIIEELVDQGDPTEGVYEEEEIDDEIEEAALEGEQSTDKDQVTKENETPDDVKQTSGNNDDDNVEEVEEEIEVSEEDIDTAEEQKNSSMDPPEEDELMRSPVYSTAPLNQSSNVQIDAPDEDELMRSPAYSTAPLNQKSNVQVVDDEIDEIMGANVAQHDDHFEASSLESVPNVQPPVQVSFPPDQPNPTQRIINERPFDEMTEKDDPTDEGYLRASENVTPTEGGTTGRSLRVAPALRTLSTDPRTSATPLKPFDELDEDEKTTVSTAPASGSIDKAHPSVAASKSEVSNEVDAATPTMAPAVDLNEDTLNERTDPVVSCETPQEPEIAVVGSGESETGNEQSLQKRIEESNNVVQEADSGEADVEAGIVPNDNPTSAKEQETFSHDRETNESYFSSPFIIGLAVLICLLIVALCIALPITMTRNKNDSDRDVVIPSGPPTSSHTITPTQAPQLFAWIESIPPINGALGSGFGSAIAIDSSLLAIGAPIQNGGAVSAFVFDNTTGQWNILSQVVESGTESFGFSIDISSSKMAIGSPLTPIVNTFIQAGSAYVYQYTANQWTRLGSELRGDNDIYSAGEEFGYSVAVASDNVNGLSIVAVGAPRSSVENIIQRGRVYTFRQSPNSGNISWEPMQQNSSTLQGKSAFDLLGSSVDLSRDGNRLAVGAVGNSSDAIGYVQIYHWSGSDWVIEAEITGVAGEGFGASVVMITDSGNQLAVGSPGFMNETGKISVYQIQDSRSSQSSGSVTELGESITGTVGERVGDHGSISVGLIDGETAIAFGTATGVVRTYAYKSETNQWRPVFEDLQAGNQSMIIGVSGSGSGSLAVGFPLLDSLTIYTSEEAVSFAPSPAPSPAVSKPLNSPSLSTRTVVPTLAATNVSSWVKIGGSFTPRETNWGYGSSASMSLSQISIGAPLAVGNGAVFTYDFNESSAIWLSEATDQLFGENSGDSFGSAIDMGGGLLVVGAPQVAVPGTTAAAGAVYCYSWSGSNWVQIGNVVRGDSGVDSAGEEFGSAVAISDNQWLVVGAKASSLDLVLGRGRVYVFNNNGSNWTLVQDVAGLNASAAYGSAVDISSDGSHFIAGSPGAGNGYATIYQFTGSNWTSVSLIEGDSEGEGLGSSVKFLSPDGSVVAIGSPNYMSGQGRVMVYEKSGESYVAKGDPILGSPGEHVGASGLLSGGYGAPSVILGTSLGQVKRFDFETSSNSWIQVGNSVDTGYGALLQVACESTANQFVVCGDDDATVYKLE